MLTVVSHSIAAFTSANSGEFSHHNEPQEGDDELTLLCLHKESVLKEPLEDEMDMLNVLLLCLQKNLNVIQVDKKEFVQQSRRTSFTSDWMLELARYFKMAQRGVEGHLPLVPVLELHQMIGVAEVKFREDLRSAERGEL